MIDSRKNRVTAIRTLREWCLQEFGGTPGLSEACDCIDSVNRDITCTEQTSIMAAIRGIKATGCNDEYVQMQVEQALAILRVEKGEQG